MNLNDVLEILKLVLDWPFISLIIFSIFIFNFKSPISIWFSRLRIQYRDAVITSQVEVSEDVKTSSLPDIPANLSLPSSEPAPENTDVQQWKAAAYLWEYRYLNHFLQFRTQQFLDWLYDRKDPVPVSVATTVWSNLVPLPDERSAIVLALTQHYLISFEDGKLSITPKGREYVDFRGKFAPISLI